MTLVEELLGIVVNQRSVSRTKFIESDISEDRKEVAVLQSYAFYILHLVF